MNEQEPAPGPTRSPGFISPRLFAIALAVGLVLRVATLGLPGHEDVLTWKIWSYAASRDVTAVYGIGGTPPIRGIVSWGTRQTTVDYPPFFLYEYAVVGKIYGALFPAYPDTKALLVAVKLPALLSSAGLTWMLFVIVRRLSSTEAPARWAALAYWLNPATIFGGEMLGYVDPLYFVPAIVALALAHFGRSWWAGALLAVAVSTKPQAILITPALGFALWRADDLRAMAKAGVTFCGTLVLIVLPFYTRGAVSNMWLAFGSFDLRRDTMSAYAANIGWIINWALRSWLSVPGLGWRQALLQRVPRPLSITRFRELGYPDPRPISKVVVIAAILWALWVARRTRDLGIIAALGALTVHAFFVLSPNLHEHHQLFEVPLLVLAAALRPGFRPLFVVVSGLVALNINYVYGAGLGMGWSVPRMITGIDLSVLIAFANIAVLFWFARRFAIEAHARH